MAMVNTPAQPTFGSVNFAPNGVGAVAFSSDGQRLATGSTDSTVKLWNAETGDLVHMFHGHDHLVSAVVFSPGGDAVAFTVGRGGSGRYGCTIVRGHERRDLPGNRECFSLAWG